MLDTGSNEERGKTLAMLGRLPCEIARRIWKLDSPWGSIWRLAAPSASSIPSVFNQVSLSAVTYEAGLEIEADDAITLQPIFRMECLERGGFTRDYMRGDTSLGARASSLKAYVL